MDTKEYIADALTKYLSGPEMSLHLDKIPVSRNPSKIGVGALKALDTINPERGITYNVSGLKAPDTINLVHRITYYVTELKG